MIIGHHELIQRLDQLFPREKPAKVGSASVDVCIGRHAVTEDETKVFLEGHTEQNPYWIYPGQFYLISMLEYTHVPNFLSCLFLLKSTSARAGFQHAFAGWIDPGWEGYLTMEVTNHTQNKPLGIWPGMPFGQLVYMETSMTIPYAGRYQGAETVEGPKREI